MLIHLIFAIYLLLVAVCTYFIYIAFYLSLDLNLRTTELLNIINNLIMESTVIRFLNAKLESYLGFHSLTAYCNNFMDGLVFLIITASLLSLEYITILNFLFLMLNYPIIATLLGTGIIIFSFLSWYNTNVLLIFFTIVDSLFYIMLIFHSPFIDRWSCNILHELNWFISPNSSLNKSKTINICDDRYALYKLTSKNTDSYKHSLFHGKAVVLAHLEGIPVERKTLANEKDRADQHSYIFSQKLIVLEKYHLNLQKLNSQICFYEANDSLSKQYSVDSEQYLPILIAIALYQNKCGIDEFTKKYATMIMRGAEKYQDINCEKNDKRLEIFTYDEKEKLYDAFAKKHSISMICPISLSVMDVPLKLDTYHNHYIDLHFFKPSIGVLPENYTCPLTRDTLFTPDQDTHCCYIDFKLKALIDEFVTDAVAKNHYSRDPPSSNRLWTYLG